MSESSDYELADSELPALRDVELLARMEEEVPEIEVALHVRRGQELAPDEEFEEQVGEASYMDADKFADLHGMSDADVELIKGFAAQHGLSIERVDQAERVVELKGLQSSIEEAFGVELQYVKEHATDTEHWHHRGTVKIPQALSGVVTMVTGLETRSAIHRTTLVQGGWGRTDFAAIADLSSTPGAARSPQEEPVLKLPDGREIPLSKLVPPGLVQSYFPDEVAALYNFPKDCDGRGETIGILAFYGSYFPEDLAAMAKARGIEVPDIQVSLPPGQTEAPQPDNTVYSLEVTCDVQVIATTAPGAKIVIYYADATKPDYYLNTIKRAIYDREHKPSVISISYGTAEGLFRQSDVKQLNEVFRDATRMGINVCVATGDGGSATADYSRFMEPAAHVSFPACCPHVLACGGTTLESDGGKITGERVFNDLNQCLAATGGGLSEVFARPRYQQRLVKVDNVNPKAKLKQGRGIPDIAANAATTTGYNIMFQDVMLKGMAGTSLAAPLWASLIARINQGLGHRVGFINRFLYQLAETGICRGITEGSNGAYRASAGWNACAGLGTPDGTKLLEGIKRLVLKDEMALLCKWIKAINHHDLERVLECYAEDAVVLDPSGKTVLRGTGEIRAAYGELFAHSPELTATVDEQVFCEGSIVQALTMTRLQVADRAGELRSLVFHQLESGRIKQSQTFATQPEMPCTQAPAISSLTKSASPFSGKGSQDVMQAQLEAYNTRDLNRFLDCYCNDAVFVNESGQTIMKGRDQIRQMVAKVFASFPNLHAEIQGEIRFGTWVVQKEKVTGVPNPNGGESAISLILTRVENNKISSVRRLASNDSPRTEPQIPAADPMPQTS